MCNKEDGLSAYDVRAEISCEETPIEVLQGKHKKLCESHSQAQSQSHDIEDRLIDPVSQFEPSRSPSICILAD